MRIEDLLHLIFQNFRARKSRVVFTVLGVSVGIGAILFLVGLGFGLQKNLLEQITTAESLLTLDITPTDANVVSLTQDVFKRIMQVPGVDKISPQAVYPGQIKVEGITSEASLNIINADYFVLSGSMPDLGKAFTDKDKDKIVINSPVASLLNLKPNDALGKEVEFSIFVENQETGQTRTYSPDKKFKIVGVFQEQGAAPQIYIKRSDIKDFAIDVFQTAKVKVKENKDLEPVRDKLISMGFSVSSLSDTIDQANKVFRIIQLVLGAFGIIALIVAAIGLINTMTITLLERTNEIGIMRAIGASSRDVRWIFLGESTFTGFLGGIGGIVIGMGGGQAFNLLVNIISKNLGGKTMNIFYYPIWFILFILALSTLVGFIAGIWPSSRAAKLNPLDALRYK